MSQLTAEDIIQPHWWEKSLVGLFLGLTLSYLLVGLFAWYGPGGIDAEFKVQFNMWMVSPLWLSIVAFTFMFKTAGQAFRTLFFLNSVAFGVFVFLRWVI